MNRIPAFNKYPDNAEVSYSEVLRFVSRTLIEIPSTISHQSLNILSAMVTIIPVR